MTAISSDSDLQWPEFSPKTGANAREERPPEIRSSGQSFVGVRQSSGQSRAQRPSPNMWTAWGQTGLASSSDEFAWLGSNLRPQLPSTPAFEVVAGFPSPTEKLLRLVGPDLLRRVSAMPELRGVRVSLRIYRFVSSEERELDLVRVELRIPGIGVEERFPIWSRFRAELNDCLHAASLSGIIGARRLASPTFRKTVSTVVVG